MQPIADEALHTVARWHFAVGGLETQQESLPLGGPISLHRLRTFPTHQQLAHSLTSLSVAGVMAHYGEQVIRHELIIDAARFEDYPERIFPTASAILAGIRIRTGAAIVCPAVCEQSWASLPTVPPNQCRAFHVERGLADPGAVEPRRLMPDDLDWVRSNAATVIRLTDNEHFATAIEALCVYLFAANDRMQVAQLWAGVEALFGIEHEIRYRLCTLIAVLLVQTATERRACYDAMRRLYGERSTIIHGRRLGRRKADHQHRVRAHIGEIRSRLSQLLTAIVIRGTVPAQDELDGLLFER